MALDHFDKLELILQSTPFLEGVETHLRANGQGEKAEDLLKLQQDAGVEYEMQFHGDHFTPGCPLRAAYQPVTPGRLKIFTEIGALLPNGPMKSNLFDLCDELVVVAPVPVVSIAPPPAP